MRKRTFLSLAVALIGSRVARASTAYPDRPIRFVVHAAPGGWLDLTTRVVAQAMSEHLGQPVMMDNRAGADGLIGIRYVKDAAPDGYTVLACASTIALRPALKLDPGYALEKDFVGVGPMAASPFLMLSSPSLRYRTLGEYVAWAHANPTKLNYASPGVGSQAHILGELVSRHVGVKIVDVPYKGVGAALPDVMSGRQNFIFGAAGASLPSVREGRLRCLGVTTSKRLVSAMDLPTLAEQGMAGMNFHQYVGLMVPSGVPRDVIERLSDALKAATASPALRARFTADGAEAMAATPDEFTEFVRQDARRMAKVVADIGLAKE